MNFAVIPFFLVANFTLPQEQNAPQREVPINPSSVAYIYNGKVDMTVITGDYESATVEVSGKMKCRNKNEAELVCQITETEVKTDVPLIRRDMRSIIKKIKRPFEIHFDYNGVTDLIVASDVDNDALVHIKLIASLFHIGANLNRHDLPSFVAGETSTFGYCNTAYNVTTRPFAPASHVHGYCLETIPFSKNSLDIVKTTEPTECNKVADYLTRTNTGSQELKIEPSVSHVEIDERGVFKSMKSIERNYERETAYVYAKENVHTVISMELENIEITEEPMPTVSPAYKHVDLALYQFSDDHQASSTRLKFNVV